jgi:hypothetical protein
MEERDNLRIIHPSGQPKPNSVKDFLNKPAHELTVGDTFLMQTGNVLIAVTVPAIVGSLSVIFARLRNSQEKHGL